MTRSKHFILGDMDELSQIPDDFLSEGDTASGAIEGERIIVRCVDVHKAIEKGLEPHRVAQDEKFVWAVMSDAEATHLELSLEERLVIDYTKFVKV